MDGKIVMVAVGVSILLFVGMWTVSLVSESVALPEYEVQEAVVFTANNTYYSVNSANSVLGINGLYNDAAKTEQVVAARWTSSGSQAKIYANSTQGVWPNITAGSTYYIDYDYQSAAANSSYTSISGTVWNTFGLIAVVLIIIAAVSILGYFGLQSGSD